MSMLVADTHAIIWYFFSSPRLSMTARAAMEEALRSGDPLFVATISLIEVAYLAEKRRIPEVTFERLARVLSDPSSRFVPFSLDTHVAEALRLVSRSSIPDMPDRIITATALHLNCPLITADQRIQTSGVVATIW